MSKCKDCQYVLIGEPYSCCTLTNLCVIADKEQEHDCGCFNLDLSGYDICYNCEFYQGGGDWGLFCSHKEKYHHLGKFSDIPCEHYKKKVRNIHEVANIRTGNLR